MWKKKRKLSNINFPNVFLFKFVVSKQFQPFLNCIGTQTLFCTFEMFKYFFEGHVLLHEANYKFNITLIDDGQILLVSLGNQSKLSNLDRNTHF